MVFSVASYMVLYQERFLIFVPVLPLLGIGYILRVLLLKQKYKKPYNNYLRNFKFIQGLLGQVANLLDKINELMDDFVYWGNPNKTMVTLNVLLLAAIGSWAFIVLNPIPLRIYIAIGIWLPAAPFSDWVVSMVFASLDHCQYYSELLSAEWDKWLEKKEKLKLKNHERANSNEATSTQQS